MKTITTLVILAVLTLVEQIRAGAYIPCREIKNYKSYSLAGLNGQEYSVTLSTKTQAQNTNVTQKIVGASHKLNAIVRTEREP